MAYYEMPVYNKYQEIVIDKSEVGREDNLIIAISDLTTDDGYFVQTKPGRSWTRPT